MKDFFSRSWKDLARAGASTKILIALGLVAVVSVLAFASTWAGKPSFVLLYSDLDASRAASIQSALATGNIRYQVSQPPGPFVIHVDETQFYAAQNAVALSGALATLPAGIQSGGSGASQVFLSAPERAQNVLKREWQELEKQLEELDFISRAHVSTSLPDTSPLRKSAPVTVAVTLTLKNGTALTQEQSSTVAKLVRYRFNVPEENVIVSDQSGRNLFDGENNSSLGGADDLFEHKRRYDADLAQKTNQVLDRVLGPGLGYVIVSSDWKYEELESVRETFDPDNKIVVSETTSKTSTPQGAVSNVGGPTGTAGNLANEFGTLNTAVPAPASGDEGTAKTSESKKNTVAGKQTEMRRTNTPLLARLSVSLFIDESRKDQQADLAASVKASLGFDEKRDAFSAMVAPFATIARDDKGVPVVPEAVKPESGPSRTTEMIIQRSVEIAAALAFLLLLVKTLKNSKKTPAQAAAEAFVAAKPPQGVSEEQFLEMLARSQVDELLKKDPERVSSILSRWATEEEPAGARP